MTQDRKDQLYDQMIAWICDHIPDDEDLFRTLTGHFGMTKEELHDHCIESLNASFPEESALTRLKQKVNANYAEYEERWLRMSPAELIERCDELEAVTCMSKVLPRAASDEDAESLLHFENLSRWSAMNGSVEMAVKHSSIRLSLITK